MPPRENETLSQVERRIDESTKIAVLGERMTATQKSLERLTEKVELIDEFLQKHALDELHNAASSKADFQSFKDDLSEQREKDHLEMMTLVKSIKEEQMSIGWKAITGVGSIFVFVILFFKDSILKLFGLH